MKPILEIQNISKKFRINHEQQPYLSIRDSLSNIFKSKKTTEDFWALKDVSFNVEQGDTVGIIGKNGAGKSTLLKVLSKITPPTSGKIICRGRIASLLEVGTGFHPELSGRENIFMNGSILGMRKAEILKNFDAIVDFSGVEKFIDTPLKHYSSGMQLRLAFAVAAFLENEILIIDEVLAVGDAEFQKKCMGKMLDMRRGGRTILFVSHDLTAISNLTKQAIFLKHGKVLVNGETNYVIEKYVEDGVTVGKTYNKEINSKILTPQICEVSINTSMPNNVHQFGKSISILITSYSLEISNMYSWISIHITDSKGKGIMHITKGGEKLLITGKQGYTKTKCVFENLNLYLGKYFVNIYLSGPPNTDVYERLEDIISFDVVMNGNNHEFGWIPDACTFIPETNWSIEHD